MPNYRCPYCQKTIRHKPEMAGDVVACSSCGGEYYEPTDPLPGVRPEKVLPPLPASPATPQQNQPQSPPSAPPIGAPSHPGPGAAGPSSPDGRQSGSPSDSSDNALSDKDFDSMIQALSAEAGMPAGNTRPDPPVNNNDSRPQAPVPPAPTAPPANMDPVEMVAALESRGLSSILVSWPPAKPYAANMAFSAGLAREGANDMLLKIAFQIIKQRWPELGSMLTDYENQVN